MTDIAPGTGIPFGTGTVHEEYARISAIYPDPLPDGYSFPKTCLFEDAAEDGFGYGLAGVYFDWQAAHAVRAHRAFVNGDNGTATEHLNVIADAYRGERRQTIIQDPELAFIAEAITPALDGDFTTLIQLVIAPYLKNPERAEIARAAGDLTD